VFGNPFVHTSVMLRRATLERVGTYSEDRGCAHVEDYDLWLRLAATSVLANLQAAVVRWRERVGSVSCMNQCRQSEQRESLSIASVQELLRPGNLHPRDWLAFKKLVRGSPREPINLDSSEVSRGLRAAQQIQQAFYRRTF
jgi:hypothetical protein